MFDIDFKYEDGKLYKKRKDGKKTRVWLCLNDYKPNEGYIRIRVNGKVYRLHRLVYFFHNPEWDITDFCRDNSIDHMDGDTINNKIENLQVVTNSQNQQNRTHMNGGKKIRGYFFRKDGRKLPWIAQWQENGKHKSKSFKTELEAKNYSEEKRQKFYYRPRLNL